MECKSSLFLSTNLFLIGIFLGHSILQFLEYAVAALVKSVERFKESLSGRISGSNHKKKSQEKEIFRVKAANSTSSYQVIAREKEAMESDQTEWEEQIGKMRREMREIRMQIGGYEN